MKRPRMVVRLIDLRPGEARLALLSFFVLILASAGYTVLETVRDALLVLRLIPAQYGFAYIGVAACALPAAGLLGKVSLRWDARRVLIGLLLVAAVVALVFTALPLRAPVVVVALYVVVGLVSSAIFPQFWVLVGASLTVGQSRRLIGPIAAAGVFGGVVGASLAAAAVAYLPLRGLLTVAAMLFTLAAGVAFFEPQLAPRKAALVGPRPSAPLSKSMSAFENEPFLIRVAILVAVTTATALVIDYFFKSTIARTIPPGDRGTFVTHFYAVMNVIALAVQLFVGSTLVRDVGVQAAIVVTPFLSLAGGLGVLVGGAWAIPVFVLRAADGSLRSSINRLTTELVYLPVSAEGREQTKPLIDGAMVRVVQALMAGALLLLGRAHLLSPTVFSLIIVALSLAWLTAAVTMREHYLGQLRRSVTPTMTGLDPLLLDLPSAEVLVEHLGSDDSEIVVAAMNTLARRGHDGLVPSLILRHPNARVLRRALEIFGAGSPLRTDWLSLARTLVTHGDENVRVAATSALGARVQLDFEKLATDPAPGVRGYAALRAALASGVDDLLEDPRVASAIREGGAAATGLLVSIADAEPSPRVARVLVAVADSTRTAGFAPESATWTNLLARATVRHNALEMIPRLIERLSRWEGRESIRTAFVSLGQPAFDALSEALGDSTLPRRVRMHLPLSLSRFGTAEAAGKLLDSVEHEPDGLVRYKSLRALGRLVVDSRISVDLARVERVLRANLATYFTLLATRVALGEPPAGASVARANKFRLLAGLFDDKVHQALERAFRLLKIAHPKEDIHRVYAAMMSPDKRERANAAEFLDALVHRRKDPQLHELLRIALDDLSPAAQVARAANVLGFVPPRTPDDAVHAALADSDIKVAALAAMYAVETGDEQLVASVGRAQEKRRELEPATREVFQDSLDLSRPAAQLS